MEDLEAVADKLGLERLPLQEISQGAAVCIEYTARHPERVSELILVGGYAAGWRHLASPEEQARREAAIEMTCTPSIQSTSRPISGRHSGKRRSPLRVRA